MDEAQVRAQAALEHCDFARRAEALDQQPGLLHLRWAEARFVFNGKEAWTITTVRVIIMAGKGGVLALVPGPCWSSDEDGRQSGPLRAKQPASKQLSKMAKALPNAQTGRAALAYRPLQAALSSWAGSSGLDRCRRRARGKWSECWQRANSRGERGRGAGRCTARLGAMAQSETNAQTMVMAASEALDVTGAHARARLQSLGQTLRWISRGISHTSTACRWSKARAHMPCSRMLECSSWTPAWRGRYVDIRRKGGAHCQARRSRRRRCAKSWRKRGAGPDSAIWEGWWQRQRRRRSALEATPVVSQAQCLRASTERMTGRTRCVRHGGPIHRDCAPVG